MGERNFREMLEARWAEGKFVCVGLDTELGKIPECARVSGGVWEQIVHYNMEIVRVTRDLVCAFKPNFAFYIRHGEEGLRALRQTIGQIHNVAPDVPVILDAKVGDIGNTNVGYVQMAFDSFRGEADAITVHPYLGAEALAPFLELANKGVIVLCRTSNKGAGEFQDLPISIGERRRDLEKHLGREIPEGSIPLYQYVAYRVAAHWNKHGNCAVVVGATYPEELGKVREIVGDLPILIPGVGAQGGDVEKTVRAGKDSRGRGMIVNSSRGIIFASPLSDWPEAARREAQKLHDTINQYR